MKQVLLDMKLVFKIFANLRTSKPFVVVRFSDGPQVSFDKAESYFGIIGVKLDIAFFSVCLMLL